jgi:hypothetical protein
LELHELFASIVEDLPPVNDQTAAAARTAHRRRIRNHSALAVACALVIGAGTVTVAPPWRHAADTPTGTIQSASADPVTGPEPAQTILPGDNFELTEAYGQYEASMIQSIWPVPGVSVTWSSSMVAVPGVFLHFDVGGETYSGYLGISHWEKQDLDGRIIDKCYPTPPPGDSKLGWSCTTAKLPNGMTVMIEHYSDGKNAEYLSVEVHLFLGLDDLSLFADGHTTQGATDAQFLALAKSPAYQQLFAAAQQHGFFKIGGPIAGWGA